MTYTWKCPKGHKSQRRSDGSCTVCVCPHGHIDPPRRPKGTCILCEKVRYAKNRTEIRKYQREYTRQNSEKLNAKAREQRRAAFFEKHGISYEEHLEKQKELLGPGWFRSKRSRAKQKGIPFHIKPEDVVVPTHCPVLGIPLKRYKGTQYRDDSPSIDRIIPELGYVPDNVVVISCFANRIKTNATPDQLRAVADWIEKVYPDWLL